jgi:hypothetical protein
MENNQLRSTRSTNGLEVGFEGHWLGVGTLPPTGPGWKGLIQLEVTVAHVGRVCCTSPIMRMREGQCLCIYDEWDISWELLIVAKAQGPDTNYQ